MVVGIYSIIMMLLISIHMYRGDLVAVISTGLIGVIALLNIIASRLNN